MYIIHPEHGIVHFPICLWLINFYTTDNNINTIYHRLAVATKTDM